MPNKINWTNRIKIIFFIFVGLTALSVPGKIYARYCCDDPDNLRSPVTTTFWYYDQANTICRNVVTQATQPLNCVAGDTCLSNGSNGQGVCQAANQPTPFFITCGNIGQPCCRATMVSLGTCNVQNSVPDDTNSPSCQCILRTGAVVPGPVCDFTCTAAMGAVGGSNAAWNQYIGQICMRPECNGCVQCNNNEIIAHETIVDECKNKNGPLSLECYINSVWQSSFNEIGSTLVGNYSDKVNSHGSGAFSGLGTMMAYMYSNPPASGVEYFADLGHSFGIARPAYAQGIGFTTMQSILPAWKASRNVAYIFFIIAFIVSGFAIMFRMKINPQTVISIQNALPKMIIAMLLVTFSYAIAGLLIDLSYLLLYLAILAFGQTGWIDIAKEQTKAANLNFWGAYGLISGGSVKAMWSVVGAMFKDMVTGGPAIGGLLGTALTAIIGILGSIIIWIVALVLMFKLFFALVACYVQVILLIFIGPILIAFDALPGSKNGFKGWLNKLMGNIMVFPGVAFLLMVGNIMASKVSVGGWNPPLLGSRGDIAGPIFGFGILMMTAKLPEIIKGMFKLKDEGYGSAIGQALGPAKSMYQGARAGVETYGKIEAANRFGGVNPEDAMKYSWPALGAQIIRSKFKRGEEPGGGGADTGTGTV